MPRRLASVAAAAQEPVVPEGGAEADPQPVANEPGGAHTPLMAPAVHVQPRYFLI